LILVANASTGNVYGTLPCPIVTVKVQGT